MFQVNNLHTILLTMFLLVLTFLTEEALFQVWMMIIHLFPVNPRTSSFSYSFFFHCCFLCCCCYSCAFHICCWCVFQKWKEKGQYSGRRAGHCATTTATFYEKSQEVAGHDIRQLVNQATGPTNNKSAWGTFLYSNLPLVHERIWPMYLEMSMENYIWALLMSQTIFVLKCQQAPVTLQHQLSSSINLISSSLNLLSSFNLLSRFNLSSINLLSSFNFLSTSNMQYQFTPHQLPSFQPRFSLQLGLARWAVLVVVVVLV